MAKRCSAIRPMAVCKQPWHGQLCKRRSEEHTSELQSQSNLVCRLLLEKKKNKYEYVSFEVVHNKSKHQIRDIIEPRISVVELAVQSFDVGIDRGCVVAIIIESVECRV